MLISTQLMTSELRPNVLLTHLALVRLVLVHINSPRLLLLLPDGSLDRRSPPLRAPLRFDAENCKRHRSVPVPRAAPHVRRSGKPWPDDDEEEEMEREQERRDGEQQGSGAEGESTEPPHTSSAEGHLPAPWPALPLLQGREESPSWVLLQTSSFTRLPEGKVVTEAFQHGL